MQLWVENIPPAVASLEVTQVYVRDGRVERNVWGGTKEGSKNYLPGTSNWMNGYIRTVHVPSTLPVEQFRCRLEISRTFYKILKGDLSKHRPEVREIRMVCGIRP